MKTNTDINTNADVNTNANTKMNTIYNETLPNGLRIVGERMENYRSVSIGCWVKAGSIYEKHGDIHAPAPNGSESGISHFIEHMLFKGTNRRSAAEIAEEIDAIGGNLNAFTSKDCTCFYVKAIGENMREALDILSDLICNSRLDEADIELEKGVVTEEIAMNEDSPEDVVHEALCSLYYGREPLAYPVLGTQQSVAGFDREMLRAYMNRRYTPENIVLSVAGNFDPAEFREAAASAFSFENAEAAENAENTEKRAEAAGNSVESKAAAKNAQKQGEQSYLFINKDIEQTHIALAFPGFAVDTPGQYPLNMLNSAVGGSMSSRLFQSIREKNGLAYSVYSAPSFFMDSGYFTLYAGTSERQAEQVLRLMIEEYRRIAEQGITEDELERSKRQMRTGYILGRENTSAHSSSLGRGTLFGRTLRTDDEILERINGVTTADVMEILPTVCDFSRMRAVIVGRVEKREEALRNILEEAAGR